ncbi:MAG: HPr family phosphocarrier protein [Planctomycetota bacterium]|nr:HPr family phosphocarrier protein [Planctomycetota bacterium]
MARATRTVTVANREGFHLRAATLFVCLAQRFGSDIEVSKGDRMADGKSTALHLAGLGAFEGDQMLLQADGDDAEEALDALAALFTAHFGEDELENNQNVQGQSSDEHVPEGIGEDDSASA